MIAIILGVLTVGLCVTEVVYSVWLVDEMENSLSEACESYEAGDKELTAEKMDSLSEEWDTHKDRIAIFLSHDTLENVSVTISMAREYLKIDDDHFNIECAKLKEQLNHISGTEMLNISNIL